MLIGFSQFRQIKASECLQGFNRFADRPMQCWRQQALHLIAVVLLGVIKPLLAMGHGLAALIEHHQGVLRQVIQ